MRKSGRCGASRLRRSSVVWGWNPGRCRSSLTGAESMGRTGITAAGGCRFRCVFCVLGKNRGGSMEARRIREERGWAGMSRRDLAKRLGVHVDTVANWETGRTRAPYCASWHLALLFGQPLPGGDWAGWILRGDTLWSPANQGFKPAELSYLWLTFEQARLWTARNRPQVVAASSPAPTHSLPAKPADSELQGVLEGAGRPGAVGAAGPGGFRTGRTRGTDRTPEPLRVMPRGAVPEDETASSG